MIFESIYLAESHKFNNRRSTTGRRNSETITLPVKAEPCGAENIEFWLSASFLGLCLSVCQTTYGYENSGFQPVFWDYVCPYVKRHTVMKILAFSQYILN